MNLRDGRVYGDAHAREQASRGQRQQQVHQHQPQEQGALQSYAFDPYRSVAQSRPASMHSAMMMVQSPVSTASLTSPVAGVDTPMALAMATGTYPSPSSPASSFKPNPVTMPHASPMAVAGSMVQQQQQPAYYAMPLSADIAAQYRLATMPVQQATASGHAGAGTSGHRQQVPAAMTTYPQYTMPPYASYGGAGLSVPSVGNAGMPVSMPLQATSNGWAGTGSYPTPAQLQVPMQQLQMQLALQSQQGQGHGGSWTPTFYVAQLTPPLHQLHQEYQQQQQYQLVQM